MIRPITRFVLAIGLALPVVTAVDAHAAKLSAADRAWIDTCITQRKETKERPDRLRKYCTCMHDVVDDNRPMTISDLEGTYPPVHEFCVKKHRTPGLPK
jgi:hypothetical protein